MRGNRRALAAVALVAALVLAGAGLSLATGFGPAPGGDGEAEVSSFPTETPTGGDGGTTGGTTATSSGSSDAAGDTPPFGFTVERIERCGQTCREVTTTLTNRQDEPARNVTVYSRIYAGNSTAEADVVWTGKEPVGTLDATASYTTTERVELSYGEAYAVKRADGWITVQTTVRTDDRTVTFTDRRRVA